MHYPQSWSVPLAILAVLCFVAVALLGVRRKQLGVKALLAVLVFLLNVVIAGTLAFIAVKVLTGLFHESNVIPSIDSSLYAGAFAVLALATTVLLYGLLHSRIGAVNLTAGAAAGWLGLTVVTAFALPGGSYLFVWPLLFSLLALALTFVSLAPGGSGAQWAALVPASVSLVLFIPVFWGLFLLMPVGLYWAGAIVASLVWALLVPHVGPQVSFRGHGVNPSTSSLAVGHT